MIRLNGLTKKYGRFTAVDGINLTVNRGETLVIMGASGCGKSTLLRCLIGAHKPDSGTVRLFGKDISTVTPKELDSLRKRFGILFQSGALFSSMTVGENVALPLSEHTDLSPEMIDLMVKVMRAGDESGVPPLPSGVLEYLFDHREKLSTGAESDVPTEGSWFWKHLEGPAGRRWLFANRKRVWAMFYGSMKVPHGKH